MRALPGRYRDTCEEHEVELCEDEETNWQQQEDGDIWYSGYNAERGSTIELRTERLKLYAMPKEAADSYLCLETQAI